MEPVPADEALVVSDEAPTITADDEDPVPTMS